MKGSRNKKEKLRKNENCNVLCCQHLEIILEESKITHYFFLSYLKQNKKLNSRKQRHL